MNATTLCVCGHAASAHRHAEGEPFHLSRLAGGTMSRKPTRPAGGGCPTCGRKFRIGRLVTIVGGGAWSGQRARVCQTCAGEGMTLVAVKVLPAARAVDHRHAALIEARARLRSLAALRDRQASTTTSAREREQLAGQADGVRDALHILETLLGGT